MTFAGIVSNIKKMCSACDPYFEQNWLDNFKCLVQAVLTTTGFGYFPLHLPSFPKIPIYPQCCSPCSSWSWLRTLKWCTSSFAILAEIHRSTMRHSEQLRMELPIESLHPVIQNFLYLWRTHSRQQSKINFISIWVRYTLVVFYLRTTGVSPDRQMYKA